MQVSDRDHSPRDRTNNATKLQRMAAQFQYTGLHEPVPLIDKIPAAQKQSMTKEISREISRLRPTETAVDVDDEAPEKCLPDFQKKLKL